MKITVKDLSHSIKPKQTEGLIAVKHYDFLVRPKHTGVVVTKNRFRSVFKTDERCGVGLSKQKNRNILKQRTDSFYDAPPLITSNMVLWLDATLGNSRPTSGSNIWRDVSGNLNHFTLYNSPTFTTDYLALNGINQYIRSTNTIDLSSTNCLTVQYLFRPLSYTTVKVLFELSENFNNYPDTFGSFYADDSYGPDGDPNRPLMTISMGTRNSSMLDIRQRYNFSEFDRSLYEDLGWKYCTYIINRGLTGDRQNFFYTQSISRNPVFGRYNAPDYPAGLTGNSSENLANDYLFIGARGKTGDLSSSAGFFCDIQLSHFSVYDRVLTPQEIQHNFEALRRRFRI